MILNSVLSVILRSCLVAIYRGRLKVGKKARVIGIPMLKISAGCKIQIGNNVTINSKNLGYHLNMHSRVKLMADRANAQIIIGDNCRIHGSCIHAYKKISIGSGCLIAANCQIFDGNGHDISFPDVANRVNTRGGAKEITIEDNVWLGANVIIMPGVRVGYGSIISAGSVVCSDIPAMSIARGNPAVVIKKYEEES